jgi:hypothetical protein
VKVKNNFISVVSLGCFNPAILTPRFLKEKCRFETHLEPKGRTTPVASVLNYGSTSFVVDLERFQIKHSDVDDFLRSAIIPVMVKYLTVLEYTPVEAIGVNLNYDITDTDVATVRKMLQENSDKLFQAMKLSEATTTYKQHRRGEGIRELVEFDIAGPIDENTVERLNILIKNNFLRMNYNHEIRNLEQNRNFVKRIEQDWHSLVENDKILRQIFLKEPK